MDTPVQLKDIKARLERNERVDPVTVRTFLSWFSGAKRRGWWIVQQIRETLIDEDLRTFPDFESAFIDTLIELRLARPSEGIEPSKPGNGPDGKEPENIADQDVDNVLGDPTYRISRLEAANKDLIFVKPDSSLAETITLMMTYDFSQLPVMQQSKRDLKGVISWRSIGQKLSVGQTSTSVRDLMEPHFQLISSDTSLFKALPLIIEHDYVLVQNNAKEICGIVTASDLSLQFKQLSEPFLLVGEIENHLRQILMKLEKTDLENGKDSRDTDRIITSVADLTFGEYLRLCQNPQIWEKLSLPLDRSVFCGHLEEVREIRNTIMHFDPDGLEIESVEILRNFVRLLQTWRNLQST